MVAHNQQEDLGTLGSNVYLSEDKKRLTFWATHANHNVMKFYSERFASGSAVGQILQRSQRARFCLYGPVSDEMKAWRRDNGSEVEYATRIAGFARGANGI